MISSVKEIIKLLLSKVIRYWKKGFTQKLVLLFISYCLIMITGATVYIVKEKIHQNNYKNEYYDSSYVGENITEEEYRQSLQNDDNDDNLNDTSLFNYTSQKEQEEIQEIITILENRFSKYGNVKIYTENNITIFSIPTPDGFSVSHYTVNNNTASEDILNSYEFVKQTFSNLSKIIYQKGLKYDKHYCLGLQNDLNEDKLLLFADGTIEEYK